MLTQQLKPAMDASAEMSALSSIPLRLTRVVMFATALGLVMVSPDSARGQDLGVLRNSSVISGQALSGVSGVTSANLAAGSQNLQSSSGSLATGDAATINNRLVQQVRIDERLADMEVGTAIREGAFGQSSGWMSVNQTAGVGNLQSNSFGMALGSTVSGLSDDSLQQVLAPRQGLNGGDGSDSNGVTRNLDIDESSFAGARGVIQVNQSAGTGNATRNSFSFRFNQ
ncbi:hypothetical protein LCL99_12730 [Halomonas denitrificans]|uniref:hypothetical protein n=1 Tax=Halomonas TaxID=2745 RepID=UPI001C9A17E3|nr:MULTISPECIES: hypothetical protein [Halomonas]MBY5968470.1 hypothetical protein [Halomonas denitrificans]MBY5984153.1 hypothetical protein [Halomonas sp. DP5Y7-2]MCA0975341.1 hypothetical protein [Halomonas denitrificans]